MDFGDLGGFRTKILKEDGFAKAHRPIPGET